MYLKVVIELRVVQFWSEMILVISNHDFMISDQIALHSVQLPLLINPLPNNHWQFIKLFSSLLLIVILSLVLNYLVRLWT